MIVVYFSFVSNKLYIGLIVNMKWSEGRFFFSSLFLTSHRVKSHSKGKKMPIIILFFHRNLGDKWPFYNSPYSTISKENICYIDSIWINYQFILNFKINGFIVWGSFSKVINEISEKNNNFFLIPLLPLMTS